jgi:hypothetical protein
MNLKRRLIKLAGITFSQKSQAGKDLRYREDLTTR